MTDNLQFTLADASDQRASVMTPAGRRASEFTLIELLVVVAIIGILVSLLLPALARANFSANLVTCKSNLRQIAIGLTTYTIDYDGFYPEGRDDGVGTYAEGRNTSYQITNLPKYNALATYYVGRFGDYRDLTWQSKLWTCPQGDKELPAGRSHAESYYSMFFNLYHGASNRLSSPQGYRYATPQNVMRKAGNQWKMQYIQTHTFLNPIAGLNFDVLAADITRMQDTSYSPSHGLMTNHVWASAKVSNTGLDPLYWVAYGGTASVNYAFTDGSARTFETPTLRIWKRANLVNTGGFATKDNYLMPHEYGSK